MHARFEPPPQFDRRYASRPQSRRNPGAVHHAPPPRDRPMGARCEAASPSRCLGLRTIQGGGGGRGEDDVSSKEGPAVPRAAVVSTRALAGPRHSNGWKGGALTAKGLGGPSLPKHRQPSRCTRPETLSPYAVAIFLPHSVREPSRGRPRQLKQGAADSRGFNAHACCVTPHSPPPLT